MCAPPPRAGLHAGLCQLGICSLTTMMMRPFLLLATVPPVARGWSAGHSLINKAVLPLMPSNLTESFDTMHTHWPPGGTFGNLTGFVTGAWAESGDAVAGPCAASISTPCNAGLVRAKMSWRDYCCAPPPLPPTPIPPLPPPHCRRGSCLCPPCSFCL